MSTFLTSSIVAVSLSACSTAPIKPNHEVILTRTPIIEPRITLPLPQVVDKRHFSNGPL